MPALRPRPTPFEDAAALYSDPDVYELAAEFSRVAFGRGPGHKSFGMDLTYYFCDLEARLYGNRKLAYETNLADHALWRSKRNWVRQMTGRNLLNDVPPKPDYVRRWRERAIPPTSTPTLVAALQPVGGGGDTGSEDGEGGHDAVQGNPAESRTDGAVIKAVQDMFLRCAARRARLVGQFAPDVTPDLLSPSPAHTVLMDGTYLKPHSKAHYETTPDGEARLVGSRAKEERRAKTQAVVQQRTNETNRIGVNHVVAATRSRFGRIVLAIEQTPGDEGHTALEVLAKLKHHLGDGIHALGYDRNLAGWQLEYTLAGYGILPITLPKRSNRPAEAPRNSEIASAKTVLEHAGATPNAARRRRAVRPDDPEQAALFGFDPTPHQGETTARTIAAAEAEQATGAAQSDQEDGIEPLELGSTRRAGTGTHAHRTVYHRLRDYQHDNAGNPCVHHLYVDDTALWQAEHREGRLVKTHRLVCTDARITPTTDVYSLDLVHRGVCDHTGETYEISTSFKRSTLEQNATTMSETDRALAALRPIAPADSAFDELFFRRNDIESLFFTLKHRLIDKGRAPSLHLDHQLLDLIHAATIDNARALATFALEAPDELEPALDQLQVSYAA